MTAAAAVKTALIRKPGPLAVQLVPLMEANAVRVKALEAEISGLALDELLEDGDAPARRKRLMQELVEAKAERDRLSAAYSTALDRDERADNEVLIAGLEAGLLEFEKVAAARTEAAQQFDHAAEALSEAWSRLRAASELITAVVPAGCHLPRGFVPANLRQLAKAAVYRHSGIGTPGDEANALPLGEPPSMEKRYSPGSIPSAAETIGGESDWIVETVRRQIQLTTQFKRGELGEVA
jgi:hypothetical protein